MPRCSCLTSRWAVRCAAWCALIAGLVGLCMAGRRFVLGWQAKVPPYLLSLMLATYALLAAAPLLTVLGLRSGGRGASEGHRAFRQAARAALMGGLAAGLATEVLCNAGETEMIVSHEWREGCATLGASCGLLLLGLYAAQADGSWGEGDAGGLDRGSSTHDGSGYEEGGRGGGFGGGVGELPWPSLRRGLLERWHSETEDGSALGIAAMRPIWVMPNWSGSAQARDHSVDDLHRSLLPPRSFTADAGDYSLPVSAAQGDAAAVAMSASSHMPSAFGGMEHSEVRSSAGGVPAMSPFVGGPCASASASGGAGTGAGLAGSSGSQAAAPSSAARSGCSTIGLPSESAARFQRDPILQPVLAT